MGRVVCRRAVEVVDVRKAFEKARSDKCELGSSRAAVDSSTHSVATFSSPGRAAMFARASFAIGGGNQAGEERRRRKVEPLKNANETGTLL